MAGRRGRCTCGVLAAALGAALFPPALLATPDLTGSWSGPTQTGEFVTTGSPGCDSPGPADGLLTVVFSPDGGLTFTQAPTYSVTGVIDLGGQLGDFTGTGGFGYFEGTQPDLFAAEFSATGQNAFNGILAGFYSTETGMEALNLSFQADDGSCEYTAVALTARGGAMVPLTPVDPAEGAPTELVSSTTVLSDARAVVSAQGQRIANFFRARQAGVLQTTEGFMIDSGSGLAAGEVFGMPLGVWVNYARSDFEDDFSRTAFDASRDLVLAGVDLSPREDMLVGLSVGWENTRLDTSFNAGEADTDGVTVSPYFAVLFGEVFSLDASFGYTSLQTDQSSAAAAASGSMDSDRWFVSGNLNAGQQFGNLYLTGRVGLLNAREYQEAFRFGNAVVAERSVKLGQWRIGGEVSYLLGDFEPYATATYEHDYSRTEVVLTPGAQPANDRSGVLVGAGVRYFGSAGLTGSFEWTTVQGREDYSENAFSLVLRGDF